MKVAAKLLAYAALWACLFSFALVLALMPKLIGDSGSLGALLTHPVPRRWLFNLFGMIFTGRHLALYVLFGLVFGVLHLLICAGLGEWEALKLPARWRGLMGGATVGMPLGGAYLLYFHHTPFLDNWCALLIVMTFIGAGGVIGLLQGHPPTVRLRTDSL